MSNDWEEKNVAHRRMKVTITPWCHSILKNKGLALTNNHLFGIIVKSHWFQPKVARLTILSNRSAQVCPPYSICRVYIYNACLHTKSLQSCLILPDPKNGSPSRSSVHGVLQARILEWVAMPSSRGSSQPRDWIYISYVSCISRWFFTTSATTEIFESRLVCQGTKHKTLLLYLVIKLLGSTQECLEKRMHVPNKCDSIKLIALLVLQK